MAKKKGTGNKGRRVVRGVPSKRDERISASRGKLRHIRALLREERSESRQSKYLHILLTEEDGDQQEAIDELREYARIAHEGARLRLRAPLAESLHPLEIDSASDPAYGYPERLAPSVLKGFLGELLAGISVEHFELFDSEQWEVPVYLFRTHTAAFQQLERVRQGASSSGEVVGRTGDDGLAFERDDEGRITRWMACEAKCTADHSSDMIAGNHEQLSGSALLPVDLLRLIEALGDYKQDDYARAWIDSLRNLYWSADAERCDCSVYACGRRPTRKTTWIDTGKPHAKYTGRRRLAAIEIHLRDVDRKIRYIYSQER